MSMLLSPKNLALLQQFSKSLYSKSTYMNFRLQVLCTIHTKNNEAINAPLEAHTFQDNIRNRRDEASRSILVQVQSAQSHRELHNYCSSFGKIKNMLHYSTGMEPLHFIIVEFHHEDDIKSVYEGSNYLEDAQAVPVQSQFLWFRAASRKLKASNSRNVKLLIENGNNIIRESEILDMLRNVNCVSEQMQLLHHKTKLNDVGTRLRFLVAKQIELAVSGMFPSAMALPFGSSVNGYGKMGCDLDLALKLNNNIQSISDETRLVFHSKASMGSERTTSQRHMEAIGDVLQLFLPGCSQVRRILQARVPIIKYYQQLADIECDLSMSNLTGVHMSDFLYLMGSIDERVRPLVFTIRRWAAESGLTNVSPGRWISNFSLTLLVIAFLQSKSAAVLPSLNTLVEMADEDDKVIVDDGLNIRFLRDPRKYLRLHPISNSDDLKTLLQKFFEYYASFDFQTKALSLNEGSAIIKPDHSALYIVNPLERGLNVSKNVSLEELVKFKAAIRNAAWALESEETKRNNWGLLNICTLKITKSTATHMNYNKQSKLLEVSKLFNDDDIEYKNEAVKNEVQSIKQRTSQHIKTLTNSSLDMNRHKHSGR